MKFSKPSYACKPGFAAEVCLSDTEPTQVLRGHVALCIFARVHLRRRPEFAKLKGPNIKFRGPESIKTLELGILETLNWTFGTLKFEIWNP